MRTAAPVLLVALLGACGSDAEVPAASRAVTVETTACGHASGTTGSGVLVDGDRVLTAAHVVVAAGTVAVVPPDGAEIDAAVEVLDPTRDLAVLRLDGPTDVGPVRLAQVDRDDEVLMVGAASSGTVDARVVRRVVMDIEDVRATTRSERAGVELDLTVERGDSGAGLFLKDELVGVVQASATERSASYAVREDEIRPVLTTPAAAWECVANCARLLPVDRATDECRTEP